MSNQESCHCLQCDFVGHNKKSLSGHMSKHNSHAQDWRKKRFPSVGLRYERDRRAEMFPRFVTAIKLAQIPLSDWHTEQEQTAYRAIFAVLAEAEPTAVAEKGKVQP